LYWQKGTFGGGFWTTIGRKQHKRKEDLQKLRGGGARTREFVRRACGTSIKERIISLLREMCNEGKFDIDLDWEETMSLDDHRERES